MFESNIHLKQFAKSRENSFKKSKFKVPFPTLLKAVLGIRLSESAEVGFVISEKSKFK